MAKKTKKAAKKAKKPARISLGVIVKSIDAVVKDLNHAKKYSPQDAAQIESYVNSLNEARGIVTPLCKKEPTLTVFPI
jgi:ribosome-binding factor A